ncbi:MAG: sensor histidine kinase N-terminal domain-containing protein, partial [Burkholderiaceae bacterium]|nr:sensor histidine kinase N-terminal domain-containing protein [Burkholderiaceae bacterium]
MRPSEAPPEDTPVPGAHRQAPSLRARLLRHVLLPLALTWLMGMLVSVLVAREFTQRAFDRSVLDDAYALAANVRISDGRLDFVLSPREVKAVLFDQLESVYFSVLGPDGLPVAGNLQLDIPAPGPYESHRFSDVRFHGQGLRAVRLRLETPEAFEVVIAGTTHGRRAMLRGVLLYSGVSQLLLLLLLAAWLWRAIQKDLEPMTAFQRALEHRHARDLAPLPVKASTRDMLRLGTAVNDLLARVARGVRAQREFAGNVAHELRTPLAGIRALASYGLAQKDPAVWREQLNGIVHS